MKLYIRKLAEMQALPPEMKEFLKNADSLKTPFIKYLGAVVRCDQCKNDYTASITETYLDPPKYSGSGLGGRLTSERYKKLKPCPVCQSRYGHVIRLIREDS